MATVLALACASGAVVLLTPPRRRPWGLRGAAEPSGVPAAAVAALPVLLGGVAAVVGSSLHGTSVALVLIAAGVGVAGHRLVRSSRADRRAEACRQRVVDLCEALVAELQAGQPPARALRRAVQVWPDAEPVAAAAELGADVPLALRRVAHKRGAEQLVRLAGAWQLCSATGSGLCFAAEQVLQTARGDQAAARRVASELASARATARLVTVLPVVVLVAADGIGARPWHFLLSTVPGLACLAAGCALAIAGLAWIDRIARSATAPGASS